MYNNEKEHSFITFTSNMKTGNISNVILMYGVEQYLVKWAVETIVKKNMSPSCVSMDFVVLDQENSTIGNIIEECNTFSMLSEKRVVWVKNFKPLETETSKGYTKADTEELIKYIGESNDATILILSAETINKKLPLVKALTDAGQEYDFAQIDRGQLISFAKKRFKAAGVEIQPSNLRLMIELSGYYNKETDYRLYNLENDIEKAIAHSDGVLITEEDISYTVDGDLETYIFSLIDAICKNQKDAAFRLLYNILDSGKEVFSILGLIVSQFELILEVKELREDGKNASEMAKILKANEYRVKKTIPLTEKFTIKKLKEILVSSYEVDRNIKTGLLSSRMALEMFIARI
ncbi:MAG: DNA polymerase III subunit delta [Anaerovoracaceae bacterium]